MQRLHPDCLHDLNEAVLPPPEGFTNLRCGILHIGLGAFHRAHQAAYTQEAIRQSGGGWGIIGVSMRSDSVFQQLTPQNGLYSLLAQGQDSTQLQVVGVIRNVLVAGRDSREIIETMAQPSTRIVTLTVTEKAYCLAQDGRSLDRDLPEVQADLDDPLHPKTVIGMIALGLWARFTAGAAPLSILSCDNLAQNSERLGALLREYLLETFDHVVPWLDTSVCFPNSMVDRIVPAVTEESRQRQAEMLGLRDEGAVATEVFTQWIIEDNFAAGRPDWQAAGAQLVTDVAPYENIKLRLLNASHSAIAYVGLIAQCETVDQVMSEPLLREFIVRLMQEELAVALQPPAEFSLTDYQQQLTARFGNPSLHHRCAQIAMDGTEKIAQRWIATLAGSATPLLRKALACWCYVVLHTNLPLDDPRQKQLQQLRERNTAGEDCLRDLLACARINAAAVDDFAALCDDLREHLQTLQSGGLQALLAERSVGARSA